MRALHVVLISSLAGCWISEETFPTQVASSWCSRLKECDERAFWTTYDDGTPSCRADIENLVGDMAFGNGRTACSWRIEEGQACLSEVWAASCDEVVERRFVDDCASPAWDCISVVSR